MIPRDERAFSPVKFSRKLWTAACVLSMPPYANCTTEKIMSLVANHIISEQMVFAAMENYGYHYHNDLWKIRQPGWVQSIRDGEI